jgi:hypothetical protein
MNKFDEKFKLLEVASFDTPGAINKYNHLVLLVSDIYDRLSALGNIIACDGIDARLHLSCEFDAVVWVKEWLRVIQEHPQIPTDEGAMIGWFANAIMAGYDRAKNAQPAETEREWIPIEGQRFWISWDNQNWGVELAKYDKGEFSSETVSGFNNPTHIMPYHPGMEKPEPPEST